MLRACHTRKISFACQTKPSCLACFSLGWLGFPFCWSLGAEYSWAGCVLCQELASLMKGMKEAGLQAKCSLVNCMSKGFSSRFGAAPEHERSVEVPPFLLPPTEVGETVE